MGELKETIRKSSKVAISGHFNPLHIGHIKLIESALEYGDELVVIVANDEQARNKRHNIFMPLGERMEIMKKIDGVSEVFASIDKDSHVCRTLEMVMPDVFCSGCDESHPDAVAEKEVCDRLGIITVYNVGNKKIRSSSEYLQNYVNSSK